MKALVVFYSRSGNTRKVAGEIANALDCDVEELIDTKKWSGPFGYLRAGRDARKHKLTVLKDIKHDPASYDLLVIGTPMWAGNISVPIRTYIAENYSKFNKVAFFCTVGGFEFGEIFSDMEKLSKTVPIATMGVTRNELENDGYKLKLREFVEKLQQ